MPNIKIETYLDLEFEKTAIPELIVAIDTILEEKNGIDRNEYTHIVPQLRAVGKKILKRGDPENRVHIELQMKRRNEMQTQGLNDDIARAASEVLKVQLDHICILTTPLTIENYRVGTGPLLGKHPR